MAYFEESEVYNRAKKKVEDIKNFYWHLAAYLIIIPIIITVNYLTGWEFKWFWFSTIGWGIGVVSHAFSVFWINGILGKNWECNKIQEFMENENFRSW